MKFFRKFISIVIVLLLSAAAIFGYNYAKKNLESLVSGFLKGNFNVTTSIGSVRIGFPLCVELKDVKISDSIDIKKVRVYPYPVSTVRVTEPVIRIKRGKEAGFLSIPDFFKKTGKDASSGTAPVSNFYFSRIHIQDGTLIYDQDDGSALEFVNITGNIENSGVFFSKGFLKNKDSDFLSPLTVVGLLTSDNLFKARLQLEDVKVSTFTSLYAKYLTNFVKDGMVDCKSDIHISNKNLIAKCFLEGRDIVLKKDQGQKLDAPVLASFILLINFKSDLVKIKNLEGNVLDVILGRK